MLAKTRSAMVLRRASVVVLTLVLMGIALNLPGLFDPRVAWTDRADHLIRLVPSAFFVAAIWMVSGAAKAVACGQEVERVLARLTHRLGICLFLGGMAFVFLQPFLFFVLIDRWKGIAWFDVPAITLGALGLLLVLMARLLRDAAVTRQELDGFL